MLPLEDSRWFYCVQCSTPAYTFPCCGNISCSGGGCDQCSDRREVDRRIEDKDYPSPLPRVEDTLVTLLNGLRN